MRGRCLSGNVWNDDIYVKTIQIQLERLRVVGVRAEVRRNLSDQLGHKPPILSRKETRVYRRPDGQLAKNSANKVVSIRTPTGVVVDEALADDLARLWEMKWKYACRRKVHPFQEAHYEDFATLLPHLFNLGVTSARDTLYTDTFCQLAQDLAGNAAQILVQGHHGSSSSDGPHPHLLAAQQLLRACALLRVARFPYNAAEGNDDNNDIDDDVLAQKKTAYALQHTLYLRAMRLLDFNGVAPFEEVRVPHVHDLATHPDSDRHFDMGLRPSPLGPGGRPKGPPPPPGGARRPHIPTYVRVPIDTLLTGQQCPVMLVLGADRTGETRRCEDALARGWAAVVVEVPGTGESPVRRADGHDAEARLWSSVLDWMRGMYFYDMDRVVVVSSGPGAAPAAIRLAESHGARLKGVVVHADAASVDEADIASVQCPLLMATTSKIDETSPAAARVKRQRLTTPTSTTTKTNGLWTPGTDTAVPAEDDDDDHSEKNVTKLSEYRRDAKGCVAQMRTRDTGKVVDGWMEDVLASRETRIRVPPPPKMCCADSSPWSEEEGCSAAADPRVSWWVDQAQQPPSPPSSEGQGEKTLWMPRGSVVA